jgi:hypothetical protein
MLTMRVRWREELQGLGFGSTAWHGMVWVDATSAAMFCCRVRGSIVLVLYQADLSVCISCCVVFVLFDLRCWSGAG